MKAAELDPARTWLFAVSVTEYRDTSFTALPTQADMELVRYFRLRGVPDDRIVFLRDRKATLLGIRTAFNAFLPRADKGDLLFFYFGGHGGRGFFCPYDSKSGQSTTDWAIPEILTRVDSFFGGDRVILTADTCYSGSLATALKARTRRDKSYTVLASTSSTDVSYGENLTRCLLDALQGNPMADIDADGRVTLEDLGKYAAADIKSSHRLKATYATFGRSREELVLASNRDAPAEPSVEVEWQGTWFPAVIQETNGDRYLIHYVGWGHEWDEWVGGNRIRELRAGQSAGTLPATAGGGMLIGQTSATLISAEPATPAVPDIQQMITRTTATAADSVRPVAGSHGLAQTVATTCPCCS
jgi:Peptidase C13 family/RNA binding activity-knot of a chromodomain